MSAMDAIMLQHSKLLIAVVVSLAAVTGCLVELVKKQLISWVDRQPWRLRMIPLQRNMMHNFGYSKSTTADETVIVDCYCFVIAICSHHLVMSLALTPVVVLGWDSAGSVGQFLSYSGAVGDLAYSIYDSVQVTLRTFFPVSFKCLGVQLPKKYFIVMVCLHHMLSMILTVPMILFYPTMRALHVLMWSLLVAGGTCYLLSCYKFSLDTQSSLRDFLRYKAIVLVQLLTMWFVRGYIWVSQALSAMMVFHGRGDLLFLCLGLVGFVLMTLFNVLMVFDSTKAAVRWLPKQLHKQSHGTKLACQEKEMKAKQHTEGLRRVQAAKVVLAAQ
mmetsp:Transcript_119058/g.167379  ORF Transcript_119058/g.167379 Transcript_119058/m.167379 type:complete len:329 (+) Transcript_119058:36-1022(+)